MTQKELVKSFLRSIWAENQEQWTEGFKMDKREFNGQWLSHKASCRAREMAVKGEIERTYINGYACFRYKPTELETLIKSDKNKRLEENQLRLI